VGDGVGLEVGAGGIVLELLSVLDEATLLDEEDGLVVVQSDVVAVDAGSSAVVDGSGGVTVAAAPPAGACGGCSWHPVSAEHRPRDRTEARRRPLNARIRRAYVAVAGLPLRPGHSSVTRAHRSRSRPERSAFVG